MSYTEIGRSVSANNSYQDDNVRVAKISNFTDNFTYNEASKCNNLLYYLRQLKTFPTDR